MGAEPAPLFFVIPRTAGKAVKLGERRYIRETGLETRIAAILEPVAADMGYDLVRVKILPDNGCTLQIMAEDENGQFTIEDCEKLSREVNPVLDVEDPIERAYHLEISSPGVDRPLVRARDFARWQGHEAKIELRDLIDGRKRFRGTIETSDGESVTIRLPDTPMGADPLHKLPLAEIAEAKLVMTDALLEAARREQENDGTLDRDDVETLEDTSKET